MGSTKFKKGSIEFQWFGDLWQMVQKYWIPEESDSYWNLLVEDANKLFEKYKESKKMERLTKAIVLCFIDFLEKECINSR